MALTAKTQYDAMCRRLKRAIQDSGRSMREIAEMTIGLDPPERLHHSHMSLALNGKNNRMISLRHALVILKAVGSPELALIVDCEPGTANKLDKLMRKAAQLSDEGLDQLLAVANARR